MAIQPFSSVAQIAVETSLTIPNVLTVSTLAQTYTINGLRLGMTILLNPTAALPANLGISHFYVSAANTLTIVFINPTAGTINGAAVVFKILAL